MKDSFRRFLRKILPARLLVRARTLSHIDDRLCDAEAAHARLAELALRREYPALFAATSEFSIYSQNGEDGILLSLIEQTGAASKTFVEIGTEDARECTTAVLAFLLGWDGLMLEANPLWVDGARRRAARLLAGKSNRVEIRQAMVTAENVNALIEDAGFHGELGVLAIDVDGIDYWLWKAIRAVRPRIVVIEYNASFGPERAVTVPYRPDFHARHASFYHGASLRAMELLGAELGYDLVAVESAGVNAFFVRRDVRTPELAVKTAAELYRPHRARSKTHSLEAQWKSVAALPLETLGSDTA